MNKEALQILKETLIKGKQKYAAISLENNEVVSENEKILELNEWSNLRKTPDAVQAATNKIEQIMRSLVALNIDFDEISVIPTFSVLVKAEDFDYENGLLSYNPQFLPDTAIVDFYKFCVKKDGIELEEVQSLVEKFENYAEKFLISVKAFIIGLASEGFELEGINKFEDLKSKGEGKITIKFQKEKSLNQH